MVTQSKFGLNQENSIKTITASLTLVEAIPRKKKGAQIERLNRKKWSCLVLRLDLS